MASREARTGAPETADIVVLLVDDEPDVASVTAVHVERHLEDVAVVTVTGGDAALERFGESVDCVVSDYEMPGVDGLELLRRVRERDDGVPFILFTARGSEEIASEAISAGVTDYLQKGVGTDQYAVLANRIDNAVARRRSEEAAAETRSRYRQLVEHSPNPILVHDGEEIMYANERVAALVGVETPEGLYGEPPLRYIHPDDREVVQGRIETVFEDRQTTDWGEYRIRREDGEVRHIESRGAPIRYDGRVASQVVLRDLTDPREREHRLESLHDATRRFVGAETPEAVGTITAEAVESIFTDPIVAIWRYDADADVLDPLTATQRPIEELPEELRGDLPSMGEDTVELAAFRAGEPRLVTEYASRSDGTTEALDTVYMFPLETHGLLNVGWETRREVTDTDRDLVGILGRTLVVALDRVLEE